MEQVRYMYAIGGEQRGPAMLPELRRLFELDKIDGSTLVWTNGMETWKPIEALDTLYKDLMEHARQEVNGGDEKDQQKPKKRKRNRAHPKITAVYVTNVPKDATEEEMVTFFGKCGLLETNPMTGKPCVKFYVDEEGKRKGDCVVVFQKKPAMENAIKLLHEAELRLGHPETALKVEKALAQPKFALTNVNSTNLSESMQQALKLRRLQHEQALSWNEEGVGDEGGLTIVVLKNLFHPNEGIGDPNFKEDLELDIREECEKFGEIKKITVFEQNPDGVVIINFRSPRTAEKCIQVMNGRWFAKRQVVAEYYDGRTDYRPKTTEEQDDARLDAFAAKLEKEL